MQRKLLTNGNIFKRTDGRWNGVVWYADEQGTRKRKSFCGTTKQEVKEKITAYLTDFDRQLTASDESKAKLEESMGRWLRVFKFPSVERGTYDRLECTAKHQIYPIIGNRVVGNITSADIKALLNHWMHEGYAYTTVKKVYNILTDYTRPVNFRKRYYRILEAAGLEQRGLHALRHTFATNLINGVKQPDGTIRSLSPRQVADLLGHSTSEITELYYVKKDTARLSGITAGFDL